MHIDDKILEFLKLQKEIKTAAIGKTNITHEQNKYGNKLL